MLLVLTFFSAIVGTLVGAFAGGGASLVLFPLLLLVTKGSYASILAITKAGTTVMTLASGKIHLKRHAFDWHFFYLIFASALIGTGIGTYFLQFQFNRELFDYLLGGILIVMAVYLLFSRKLGLSDDRARPLTHNMKILFFVYGVIVNILNGIFGGGGLYITIFLVGFLRFSFIRAIAYVMSVYALVNIVQTSYLLFTEPVDWVVLIIVVVGGVIGGTLGTHLQYLNGNAWVKRIAVVMMIAVGVKVLIG